MTQVSYVKVGEVYCSDFFGEYIVLEMIGRDKNRRYLFKIKFLDTGYETTTNSNIIYKGQVKDYWRKLPHGGYMEKPSKYFDNKKIYKKLYHVWTNMRDRCYSEKSINYLSYGGRGVLVSESWESFYQFYKDVQNIPGWNEESFLLAKIDLDKDFLAPVGGVGFYSAETCIWMDRSKNRSYTRRMYRKSIEGISPSGEKFIFNNMLEFARNNKLTAPNIYSVLIGLSESHKGWKFSYIFNNI